MFHCHIIETVDKCSKHARMLSFLVRAIYFWSDGHRSGAHIRAFSLGDISTIVHCVEDAFVHNFFLTLVLASLSPSCSNGPTRVSVMLSVIHYSFMLWCVLAVYRRALICRFVSSFCYQFLNLEQYSQIFSMNVLLRHVKYHNWTFFEIYLILRRLWRFYVFYCHDICLSAFVVHADLVQLRVHK